MRLQDPDYTSILLVTLPETTPVSEAAALQDDLRRARIEPFAWVVNRSLAASGTRDPVLAARLAGEAAQMARVTGGLAKRTYVVPWVPAASRRHRCVEGARRRRLCTRRIRSMTVRLTAAAPRRSNSSTSQS